MKQRIALAILIWVMLALNGCEQPSPDKGLETIKKRGTLVVLTRNAPTTYYLDRDHYAGPEYDMMHAFAEHLGVKARFVVYESLEALLNDLAAGKGDIAAAGLTLTKGRSKHFLTGPQYQKIKQEVVCRRGGKRPDDIAGLSQVQLTVVAHSSYVARLTQLRAKHPNLTWEETDQDTEELLERVWSREIDCTIADSNIVAVNRRYHPELVVTFSLTEPEPLVWYLPPEARSLNRSLHTWFDGFRAQGLLAQVRDRYYGFVQQFDYVDTRRFLRRIKSRLPRYRKWFETAAKQYGVRWTLLAAQAYQESHWRARASSPTGVRGIMMLTQPTAKELGIKNRLDPKQSIFGGARYLRGLKRRIPDEVVEPDRTWFALAAYNVGLSHLHDAMKLAEQLDRNPYLWADLKTVLPLLSQKKYYRNLDYGYARGEEPVRYVNQIRNFEDLMVQQLSLARR